MRVQSHHSLQSLNTFQVPAVAAHYIRFHNLQDIEEFCASVDLTKITFYILGGGSNTLFVSDFPGYVLHVQLSGIEIVQETSQKVLIKAAAGVVWNELVLFCVERGFGGIENLSLIPGTVGGATVQNVGAYGVELKDVLDLVEAIELMSGRKRVFEPSTCGFTYRKSLFKAEWRNRYLITSITLALHKEEKFTVEYAGIGRMLEKMGVERLSFKAISDAVVAVREQKLPDPAVLGNAGSFFLNPLISRQHYQWLKERYPSLVALVAKDDEECVKVSAAWLIEAAGLKGERIGHVGIYSFHSLILVNYGGATGRDVLKLAIEVQQKVKSQFDIVLIPEVNLVYEIDLPGNFLAHDLN